MKKTLSIILSIVMLISISAGIDLSAYADIYYESENNDTYQTANNIPLNSTIYGCNSNSKDYCDYYKFTLSSSGKVNIAFPHDEINDYGSWNICIYKYIEGNGLNTIVDKNVEAFDGTYNFPSLGLSNGTYYIKVYANSNRVYGVEYGITVNYQQVDNWEKEFNDRYQTANDLSIGKTMYGCNSGSKDYCDYYKFTLSSSGKVNIAFSHDKINDSGSWNICIYKYIEGNELNTIADENVEAFDGTYNFSSLGLSKGTYYIEVYANSNRVYGVKYGITVNYHIDKPSSFKVASRGTSSLKLSWSNVSGASGYQLQYKSGDSYKTITSTTSPSVTVKNLKSASPYKFRVRAYKTVNGTKCYGSWAELTTSTKPSKVSIKSPSTNSKHQIIVKWNKVTRASGYQVQYCKNSSCSNVIATKIVSGGSKTSYTGKGFTKGKKYYVRVRAYKTVDGTKYYGAWSSVKSIKCK